MLEMSAAPLLLLTSSVLGVMLGAHVLAVRHLPVEEVPAFLLERVELSVRLRPWVVGCAVLLALTGLALLLT